MFWGSTEVLVSLLFGRCCDLSGAVFCFLFLSIDLRSIVVGAKLLDVMTWTAVFTLAERYFRVERKKRDITLLGSNIPL